MCEILGSDFFQLWEYVWFDRCFSFNLWYKNWRPTFWHYPRHSTRSQSCTISIQRPKCATLPQAGTHAYKTVGNRPVKGRIILNRVWKVCCTWKVSMSIHLSRKKGGTTSVLFSLTAKTIDSRSPRSWPTNWKYTFILYYYFIYGQAF